MVIIERFLIFVLITSIRLLIWLFGIVSACLVFHMLFLSSLSLLFLRWFDIDILIVFCRIFQGRVFGVDIHKHFENFISLLVNYVFLPILNYNYSLLKAFLQKKLQKMNNYLFSCNFFFSKYYWVAHRNISVLNTRWLHFLLYLELILVLCCRELILPPWRKPQISDMVKK